MCCVCLLCLQLREAAAQSSDVQREVGLLRQALADKERQLAVLLAETERLQGRQVSVSSSSCSSSSSSWLRDRGQQQWAWFCQQQPPQKEAADRAGARQTGQHHLQQHGKG
jgi:hypothetical protein